jgi:hypothetical protein
MDFTEKPNLLNAFLLVYFYSIEHELNTMIMDFNT